MKKFAVEYVRVIGWGADKFIRDICVIEASDLKTAVGVVAPGLWLPKPKEWIAPGAILSVREIREISHASNYGMEIPREVKE